MAPRRTRQEQKADLFSAISLHGPLTITQTIQFSRLTNRERLYDLLSELIEDEEIIIMRGRAANNIWTFLYDLPRGREQPPIETEIVMTAVA